MPSDNKYVGTDGREYRGREVKARKWLEARIKDYLRIAESVKGTKWKDEYSCPGAMKCRK